MKLKSGVIGASENEKDQMKGFRLTSKSTDEEVIRWTKFHDVFDRLETGVSEVVADHDDLDEAFREAIFQDNTAQLNMRLPPAMKAVLSKLAPSAQRTRRPLPGMARRTVGTETQSGMDRRMLKRFPTRITLIKKLPFDNIIRFAGL